MDTNHLTSRVPHTTRRRLAGWPRFAAGGPLNALFVLWVKRWLVAQVRVPLLDANLGTKYPFLSQGGPHNAVFVAWVDAGWPRSPALFVAWVDAAWLNRGRNSVSANQLCPDPFFEALKIRAEAKKNMVEAKAAFVIAIKRLFHREAR